MSQGSAGGGLSARLATDLATLDAELAEIDLLIAQATAESERHEQKRVAAADKLAGAQAGGEPAAGLVDQAMALVTLSRRAALMEAQVDVLTGKRKVLARYRDAVAAYREELPVGVLEATPDDRGGEPPVLEAPAMIGTPPALPLAGPSNRVVLAAQEELRREIARAMHDGPAQSLTNIVLQAQIVERIVERDPVAARDEVAQLVAMVQRTMDATKSFISDVRPMVLDDLGLVPTLRGAARDRGRRTGIVVGFESFGADRRLPTDVESGLFRLLDDALEAYLALRPDHINLRLDWSDQLEARITATRGAGRAAGDAAAAAAADLPADRAAADLPPALAAMIAQRHDDQVAAAEAARRAREIVLPPAAWDQIRARAESLGMAAELVDGGETIVVSADLARLGAVAAR
jgi:two-component system sensor histidine kinase DegS